MIRRARIALALFALSTLCAAPAVFADGQTSGGDLVTQILAWLTGVVEGEDEGVVPQANGTQGDGPQEPEFNPQHLPGG